MATKVHLRKRLLPSGKITLYLDFYPAIRNPRTMQMTRRDYLGIYLIKNPRTPQERQANATKLQQAEGIRSQREISIINEQYGFIDKAKQKLDFLIYFNSKVTGKHNRWESTYRHFQNYVKKQCTFADITLEFCEGFQDYLLTAPKLNSDKTTLAQNSASNYWATFCELLKMAHKEKYLLENIEQHLDNIALEETEIKFLIEDEIQALHNTPCKIPVLKKASLFSCDTGLRFSDIQRLKWDDIQKHPDGGDCVVLRQKKTKKPLLHPINSEALEICGKRTTGTVFVGLTKTMVTDPLTKWQQSAGITDPVTFHGFRHTFATRLISKGVPIYTVSKMLGHKSVKNTERYAKLLDSKKREASEKIKINIQKES